MPSVLDARVNALPSLSSLIHYLSDVKSISFVIGEEQFALAIFYLNHPCHFIQATSQNRGAGSA